MGLKNDLGIAKESPGKEEDEMWAAQIHTADKPPASQSFDHEHSAARPYICAYMIHVHDVYIHVCT